MLAPVARLDRVGNLASHSPPPSQCAGPVRTSRSFPSGHRQPVGTCRFWGDHTGPNPTDRAKKGCKRHVLTDAQGIPLAVQITPANVHDSRPALPLLDALPPIQGPRGRPRCKPDLFQGDAAYGTPINVQGTRERGITPLLSKPRQPHGSGLGRFRYVVERTHTWFGQNRRLRLCYEKCGRHFQAFHELAAALFCARRAVALQLRF